MKKILTLLAFLGTMTSVFAQSTGEIKGKITDEKGEGMISATVVILDAAGKNTGRGTVTDFDGNYTLGPLTAGKYDLKFSYAGYSSQIIQGVQVSSDKSTFQSVKMALQVSTTAEVTVVAYKKPLIDAGDTKIEQSITKDDIKNSGNLSVQDVAANAAGVTQSDAGGSITINGSREDEVQYIVNGHRMMGNTGKSASTGLSVTQTVPVPTGSIKEISVLAGGISAKYGDVTAGVVNITLQDAYESWGGNIEAKTTRGLDPFGTTRVDGSVYGPLIKIRDKKDSTSTKRTLLGLSLGAQYQQDVDRTPSSIGIWQVNQSTLNDIRNAPLTPNPNGGFYNKADFITFANMYKTSAKPNNSENNYTGNGEIGLNPTKDISITIGGDYNYDKYNNYVREYSLLNSEHNPLFTGNDYLIYGRFTQRIGNQQKANDSKAKHSGVAIENANYSIQFDYEKLYRGYEDQAHGSNLFDYGYIGKFETQSVYNYSGNTTKVINGKSYTGFVQNSVATDTAVVFTPGTVNPLGAAFTKEYYQLLGAQENANGGYYISGNSKVGFAQTVDQINASQAGLINGERSINVDNLWYNVGRQYNGYGVDVNNQSYRGKAEGAFDIVSLGGDKKNTHKIELGVEYEQRIQRSYSINPLDLWTLGRNLVNTHLTTDTANPILRINGQNYSATDPNLPQFYATDTILYGQKANLSQQSYFDRNVRTALGLNPNGADNIDFFAVDPNKLSLKLFSADELLSYTLSGSPILNYEGYDYQGHVLSYQPTVKDFFTQKNADGQYTRPIGAFMPIYAAGYIQDKFFYKDMGFVVGLRIDRYDANQEVLKDKYSLYEIKTAGQVASQGVDGTKVSVPSNIGSNYAVYVDKNGSGAQITGYRDGDNWYDKYGRPSTGQLVGLQGSNGVLPYLNIPGVDNMTYSSAAQYIKSSTYDPSVSFTNYKAQYLVMPRLQYSFNITNQAQFFAHYDVLSQRPQARNDLDIAQYYYFTEYTGLKNNPDLKPIKKTDYEFGFKQQVAEFAAVTLSAFYQETRNLIDVRQIQYAFPATYTTYDNIDFRSAKGVRLLFDMRRIQNFKLSANYTLQFVEGTGSDDQSALNLVSSNLPNFRTVYPVSSDNRHQLKFVLDYRFEGGRKYNGPVVNNYQILADCGLNLILNLRSGSPTRESATVVDAASITSTARGSTTSLNGRLPWYSRVDLKFNKDFTFKISKKSASKDPKVMGLSVYVYIQNLLNTENVLTVYPYTLNANDDGYLKSAGSAVNINSQPSAQAYKDLYKAKVNNPDNYSLPRRVYLGVNVNF